MAENLSSNYPGGYMKTKYQTSELWSPNLVKVSPFTYPTEPSTSVPGIGKVGITKEQPKFHSSTLSERQG